MAANMFMEIDKIPGDGTEGNHKNWIVLESATFELERAVDMTDLGSNQRSHANTNFQKIELTSQIGKASNELALAVANGTVKDSVTMHWCRSGDGAGLCKCGRYSRRNMGPGLCGRENGIPPY